MKPLDLPAEETPSILPSSLPLLADLLWGMRNPKFDIWTRMLAAQTILRYVHCSTSR
jgi:hypothetical protein